MSKPTREQFSEWFNENMVATIEAAPDPDPEEPINSYPEINDAGEELNTTNMDKRSSRDKFSDFLNKSLSYNPLNSNWH